MNMQLRLTRKLTPIVTLAAGCLLVCPSAGAATVRNSEPIVDARSTTHNDCPPPSDLDTTLASASDLMGQSRFQDAAALLQPLSDKDCDFRVSLLLAAAMEGQGNVPKAKAVLQKAHATWPSNSSIAASLAREYLNSGEVPQAVKALADFRVTPRTPEQEIRMAVVVYLAAHDLFMAQKLAEVAYKSYTSASTLLLLANTLQLQGRYPDVIRLLNPKRGIYSGSPEFLVTLAESEFDASSYPAARQDLQSALALDPNLYQAHYLLGNALLKLNDIDGAIAEYHRAIRLAPDQPRTYFQLALALQAKQDDSGEQHALEQALATDRTYAPAQCEMGRILLEEHRPADAVGHLVAAVQSNPHSEKAYFLLARAYAQLGQKEKSDEMVKRLLAVKKENRPAQSGKNIVTSPSISP
jgi:tetratricopeptide (TPR) repeat protein